ncbi:unnamed protein product [Amoebophrya sp. A120]|nr:unnamed protein product [Amoebophrya sp. A120]|eukprot:GSA120T00025959001.1
MIEEEYLCGRPHGAEVPQPLPKRLQQHEDHVELPVAHDSFEPPEVNKNHARRRCVTKCRASVDGGRGRMSKDGYLTARATEMRPRPFLL